MKPGLSCIVLTEADSVFRLDRRTTELELWTKGRTLCTSVDRSSEPRDSCDPPSGFEETANWIKQTDRSDN